MTNTTSIARAPASLLCDTLRLAVLAATFGATVGLAPLGWGGSEAHGAEGTRNTQMSQLRIGANAYGRTQQVEIGLDKSMIVDLPADAVDVIVSRPAVAGAIMRNKRRAIIQGNSTGETNIFFLDASGAAISVLDVSVSTDSGTLVAAIRRLIPGSDIEVQNFGGRLVLSGTAQSQDDVKKAVSIADQFSGGSGATSVINVAGSQQVSLKVTIAEVNRQAANQLGINFSAAVNINGINTTLLNQRGIDDGSAIGAGGSGQLGIQGTIGPVTLDASLRALASRNAVRMLAEPTLTARSGERADFLVGGEFPIQRLDPTTNQVSFEFKEYGIKLGFTPTIRSDGIIALDLETEVSDVVSPAGQLSTRRASTSVELPNGSTLAIGGLLQDRTRQQINRLPFLGDIPILGTLFRSRDYIRSKTELVIMVTPYLAYPGPKPKLPTDGYVAAGDAEAIFLGRMESIYGVGPDGTRGSYNGSVGFLLD